MKKIILLVLFAFLILFCEKGDYIARVGNSYLTKKALDAQLPSGVELPKENLSQVLEKWVSAELLYQEAKRKGLDKREDIKYRLEQLVKDYLVNEFVEEEVGKITVSPAEALDYFNKHKEEFLYEVKISRIVVADENLANSLLAAIKSGKDFKALAQEFSQDLVLKGGEESVYIPRGSLNDPTLEEIIFSLAPNSISEVIKTQEGYQIIKLIDKKKVKKDISFKDVSEYINNVLKYRKSREHLDNLLAALRSKTKVEIRPEAYFQK
ncbi:MAG: peptidylprolyl isomerase [candidate division WOR-3 bacterium]